MSDLGEVVPLAVDVRDVAGAPMNAATVTLTLTRPDLTTEAVDVLNPPLTVGHYTAEVVPTVQWGLYIYRWATTGPNLVHEGSFNVDRPGAVGIISLAEAKELLGMQADNRYDEAIGRTLRAATRLAERVRREKIMRTEVSETRDLGRSAVRALALTYRPVIAMTRVDRLGHAGQVLESYAPPLVAVDESGILTAASRTMLWGRLRLVYVAGYVSIPEDFREAVGYILQSLWTNRRGAGGRPRVGGQDAQGDPGADTRSVPSRALDLLGVNDMSPFVG